jgi:hypothetical protein
MAGNIGRDILVRLRLSSEDFKGKIREAEAQTKTFASGARGALSAIQANWFAVTAAVTGTALAIRSAIAPAIEWEQQQMKLRVLAQGSAADFARMREIIDANAGGMFSRTDVAGAVSYAKAVGFNMEKVAQLLPMLRDVAAMYGGDLTTAMMAVVRAAKFGEAELAERIGLRLRENAVLEISMGLYGKRLGQLSEEQKETVILQAAVQQLSNLRGGEEMALNTVSGASRALSVELKELRTEAIEPSLEPLAAYVSHVREIVAQMREWKETITELQATPAFQVMLGIGAASAAAGMWAAGVPKPMRDLLLSGFQLGYPSLQKETGSGGAEEGPPFPIPESWGKNAGADAYDKWLEGFIEKAEKDEQIAQFMERYAREQVGPAWGAEPGIVGGTEYGAGDLRGSKGYTGPAIAVQVTELTSAQAEAQRQMQNSAEIEAMTMAAREEAWEKYGATAQLVTGSIADSTANMLTLWLNREVSTSKKVTAAWNYAGKSFAASIIQGIADAAKQKAGYQFAEAIAAFAVGNAASGALHLKSAAAYTALAGVAGGAAGAIAAGAQRELAKFGRETEPAPGEMTRRATDSGGRTVTGQLSASIARAPETLIINITNIIENPTFFGTDSTSLRSLYDENIEPWVQDSVRTGRVAA